jgi:hypothetical protein
LATILRPLSYQYQWLYDGISRLASLAVGGEARFRQLALEGLKIAKNVPFSISVVVLVKPPVT